MQNPQMLTITFVLVIMGLVWIGVLLYAFTRAVSRRTYEELERDWKKRHLRRESGRIGEETVAHELAFLPREYRVLNFVFLTAPGRERGQQMDHIVIGPNGLFHLETKNDLGKIVITQEGDWLIKRENKKYQGMRNPLGQLRRHELVLREWLEELDPALKVPIRGAVVLSRAETMTDGLANSPVPVIKADRLHDFITGFPAKRIIGPEEIERIYEGLRPFELGPEDPAETRL